MMYTFIRKNKLRILLIFTFLFLITCNYHFESVVQPDVADPNSTFDVEITVSVGAEDRGGIPYFGILLPVGWSVKDSIPYTGVLRGTFVHSVEQSDTMETEDNAPDGYYWWVSIGDTVDSLLDGTVSIKPQIKTDNQVGMFFLDFMLGDNSNSLNMRRSNHHPISVGLPKSVTVTNTNDSGAGSLRQAIDSVSSGGEIDFDLTYPATILLDSQLVIDRSIRIVGPEEGLLAISAGHKSRVMWINENLTASLSNLSLSEGRATGEIPDGGAIYSNSSDIFLNNVTINNNSADNDGGGIYISGSKENNLPELTLSNVTIRNNSANKNGGGIYIGSSQEDKLSIINLLNVHVSSNTASESGGGICCENTKNTTIKSTVIADNNAKNGGGLYFSGSALSLLDVTVKLNNASAWGGGIFYTNTDSVALTNSIIAMNSAFDGGGIRSESSITTILTNVTLVDNKVFGRGGKGGAILSSICEDISLINSIVWNNLPENIHLSESTIHSLYSNIPDWRKNEGVIDADPLFADSINYYLSENSPCIDSGHPDTIFYDQDDPDNPGYALWPAVGSIRNDMGAYGGHGKFRKFMWDVAPDIPDGTIHAVDFIDENVGWLASQSYLLKTEDGGQNWIRQLTNTGRDILFFDFIDESSGWAVEQDKASENTFILKTENGGGSWLVQKQLTSEPFSNVFDLQVINSNVVFSLVHERTAKIYRTLDGGSIWRAITFSDEGLGMLSLYFKDIHNGIGTGGSDIMMTIDGGNSWETRQLPGYFTLHSLQMMDYESCFFMNNQYLYKTIDRFDTWTILLDEVTSYFALDNSTIFAIVDRQKFVKSINGGSSWQEIHLGQDVYTMIQFVDHLNGWVSGEDGSILRTTNGGDSWVDQKVDVVSVLGIEKEPLIKTPDQFYLSQNYPNPFNPVTKINYQLPMTSHVELTIYNLLGQKVTTLVSEKQLAGHHHVQWDAANFASGIYYYIIRAGDFIQTKKMILLR